MRVRTIPVREAIGLPLSQRVTEPKKIALTVARSTGPSRRVALATTSGSPLAVVVASPARAIASTTFLSILRMAKPC